MIWTLILRFTIADIRYPPTVHVLIIILTVNQAKKVYRRKKAYSCGVNEKRSLIKKSMFKTSRSVGRMGLLCSCIGISKSLSDTHTFLLHSQMCTYPLPPTRSSRLWQIGQGEKWSSLIFRRSLWLITEQPTQQHTSSLSDRCRTLGHTCKYP